MHHAVVVLIALTSRVQRASTVFGVLEFVALAFLAGSVVVGVVWVAWSGSRARLRPLVVVVRRWALWSAFAVAAVCTGGSLWLSEVGNLPPCRFCWFQRVCMYPLTVVTAVAAIRRDRGALAYALPLAVVGMGLSTYHYVLEWNPSLEGGSGCDPLNPCTIVWFRRFGFASIPFMALTGFVTIAVLVVLATRQSVAANDHPDTSLERA